MVGSVETFGHAAVAYQYRNPFELSEIVVDRRTETQMGVDYWMRINGQFGPHNLWSVTGLFQSPVFNFS